VAQLALAHETEQLTRGSEVRISVVQSNENRKDDEADEGAESKLRISIKKPDQKNFVDLMESMSAANASLFA
jgi:hypothetical protein